MSELKGRSSCRNAQTPDSPAADIPDLVGQLYEAAPASDRVSLLRHLTAPLGLMAAVAVANGVFARLWFARGLHDDQIRIEDTLAIGRADVCALVNYLQQASLQTLDGIVAIALNSPVLATTAVSALLVTTIGRRAGRTEGDKAPRQG